MQYKLSSKLMELKTSYSKKQTSPVRAKHNFVPVHQHVLFTERTRQSPEGQTEADPLERSGSDVLQAERVPVRS